MPLETDAVANILIVDDLAENLLALEALIRADGRRVFQAGSGDAALALLLEHDFALAILDVQMPGMNGFELAELMRGTGRTRHIPLVFVSAAGQELNYAFHGYESGAVDFLHKPLDMQAVRSKVTVFVDLWRQRRQTERQMVALADSHDRQQALLTELNAAQAELQRAVRMRDDFMSLVSHELRTPLNTLFLDTQTRKLQLERSADFTFSHEQLTRMVERDGRQIQSMVRLIDDMLDVSRLRSGTLSIRLQPGDLARSVAQVADSLSQQAEQAGCALRLALPPSLAGIWDAFRIEQVVVNLLTNAIRYGAGKPIDVRLAQRDDHAVLEVQDHGVGIAAEDQQRIFQQFERASAGRSIPGLGLGLFISQQIVVAHQGRLEVDSVPGDGSTFRLVLPLRASDALTESSARGAAVSSNSNASGEAAAHA